MSSESLDPRSPSGYDPRTLDLSLRSDRVSNNSIARLCCYSSKGEIVRLSVADVIVLVGCRQIFRRILQGMPLSTCVYPSWWLGCEPESPWLNLCVGWVRTCGGGESANVAGKAQSGRTDHYTIATILHTTYHHTCSHYFRHRVSFG